MKNNYLALLAFICSFFTVNAQNEAKIDSLYRIGISFHDNKMYEEAISCYNQAIALDSTSAFAKVLYYEAAYSYTALKNNEKALEYADKSLASDEYYIDGLLLKGNCLDDLKQYEQAIKCYEKAYTASIAAGDIKLAGSIQFNKGISYFRQNDMKQAEAAFKFDINLRPDHVRGYQLLGVSLLSQNQYSKSIYPIAYALWLDPNSSVIDSKRTYVQLIDVVMQGFDENYSSETKNLIIHTGQEKELTRTLCLAAFFSEHKSDSLSVREKEMGLLKKCLLTISPVFADLSSEDNKSFDSVRRFLAGIASTDHFEAFFNHITIDIYPESFEWIRNNIKKVESMEAWLEEYNKKTN